MDLSNIRVLDLTQFFPGPYATQILRDYQAEVIKVERPQGGDPARQLAENADDELSELFYAVNRGKKSIQLDLTAQAGRQAFYKLTETADVVIEQFRPGVVDRLGVDYETLTEYNSEIIYCSLTGYGQTGPYQNRPGHDLTYLASSGLLSMNRPNSEEKPTMPAIPIADAAGSAHATISILTALLSRELSDNNGTYLDISMTDALISFSQMIAQPVLTGSKVCPGETTLTGKYPCYDVYETAHNRYIAIAALEKKFWAELCETLDRPELIEHHRSSNAEIRDMVRNEIADEIKSDTLSMWEDQFSKTDVPFAPVTMMSEVLEKEYLHDRGLIRNVDGTPPRVGVPMPNLPSSLEGETIPDLGEHTEEILKQAGVDDTIQRKILPE
ncbi:CoA transferase [Salinarchaeum sp. IM2453]|uniref:CaiB/BaiF CoA transferase family protein n=1 Tax=Salinarchaeum sp. IM2453 TaxID=2862870 RepID=UPI001C8374A9|nr:CaiB/BaiF CoA-transferase family protein [Salinarchaeum sp. IM2453]QZA88282.1 CoA transferase [Salinarchaeum sp. IM2453]